MLVDDIQLFIYFLNTSSYLYPYQKLFSTNVHVWRRSVVILWADVNCAQDILAFGYEYAVNCAQRVFRAMLFLWYLISIIQALEDTMSRWLPLPSKHCFSLSLFLS